jgi:hypothetical protein
MGLRHFHTFIVLKISGDFGGEMGFGFGGFLTIF